MCMLVLIADRWWVFFFKQKTAYEMRISDWSSDVCSSDLRGLCGRAEQAEDAHGLITGEPEMMCQGHGMIVHAGDDDTTREVTAAIPSPDPPVVYEVREQQAGRSEEHTSELQSLMRISYAVFCLKKKNITNINNNSKT